MEVHDLPVMCDSRSSICRDRLNRSRHRLARGRGNFSLALESRVREFYAEEVASHEVIMGHCSTPYLRGPDRCSSHQLASCQGEDHRAKTRRRCEGLLTLHRETSSDRKCLVSAIQFLRPLRFRVPSERVDRAPLNRPTQRSHRTAALRLGPGRPPMRDGETKCISRGLPRTARISRAGGPDEVPLLGRFRSCHGLFQIARF